MRIRIMVLATLFTFLMGSTGILHAYSETMDPFVSNPLGPYSMLSNPASVLRVQTLSVRASVGLGTAGGTSQLLAYLEPDMGLGAGALYWHTLGPGQGERLQEFGYTLARQATNHILYGFTVKQLSEAGLRAWAADFGLILVDFSRVGIGFTVHNFLGQSTLNPFQVTGALAYEMTPLFGLAAFASAPVIDDASDIDVGLAVDVTVFSEAQFRLGRVSNLRTSEGYWQGSFTYDFDTLTFDATVVARDDNDLRVAVGVVFRF